MDQNIAVVSVLVAVYGHEPQGWARTALAAVAPDRRFVARLLVILDVPRPSFTSLTPWARRRYEAAHATALRLEEDRARPIVDDLQAALGGRLDVVRAPSQRADPGRAIAEHALDWGADLVVVAQDTSSTLHRALFGAVHERVVRHAPCAVVVVPAQARNAARSEPLVTLASARGEAR